MLYREISHFSGKKMWIFCKVPLKFQAYCHSEIPSVFKMVFNRNITERFLPLVNVRHVSSSKLELQLLPVAWVKQSFSRQLRDNIMLAHKPHRTKISKTTKKNYSYQYGCVCVCVCTLIKCNKMFSDKNDFYPMDLTLSWKMNLRQNTNQD